jgi:hypothetical protein
VDQFTGSDFVAPGFRRAVRVPEASAEPAGVDLGVATSAPTAIAQSRNFRPVRQAHSHPEGIRPDCPVEDSGLAGKDLSAKSLHQPTRRARTNRSSGRYLQLLALAAFLLASAIFAPTARAQGDSEFGIWGGFSAGNPHLIGVTSDRQLGVLGLRYGHLIFDTHPVSLEYTLDIIPVEILHQPTYVACDTNPIIFPIGFCQTGHETVYGGGLNPLGLKLNFFREHRLQPFVASTAGLVASVRPIPVDIPEGTQFNFTFDFQAGFQLYNSDHSHAWTLAYKYQHISNAYRHSLNPGVDLHVITLGYSFFR